MTALNSYLFTMLAPGWQVVATSFLFFLAAYGLGYWCLQRQAIADNRLLNLGLGWALLGVVFQGGYVVLKLPVGLWVTPLALLAIYGVWQLRLPLKKHPGTATCAGILLLLTLGAGLLPPYGWDEQVYQLALPWRFTQTGSSAVIMDNPYSGFPLLPNFIYQATFKLGGITVPRMLNILLTPLLLSYLWHKLRPCGRAVAWSVVLAVGLSPVTLTLNRTVYVENFLALFTLSGIEAAQLARRQPTLGGVVAGILSGAAAAVKLTGAGSALLIMLFLPWKSRRMWWSFLPAAGLTALGFYLRPWLQTGNPMYPFVLGASEGSVAHFHQLLGSARYGLEGVQGLVMSWLFAAFDGKIFDGIPLGGQLLILVAIAALGIWYLFRNQAPELKALKLPALAVLIGYLFWALTSQQTRFIFPVFLLLAWLAGLVLGSLPLKLRKWGVILLLATTLLHPVWWPHVKHYYLSWKLQCQLPSDKPANFLAAASRDPGYYAALNYLATTPPESRVLLLCERRGLYVPRWYNLASPRFEASLTPCPKSAAELWEKIRKFDYILCGATTQDVDFQELVKEEYATIAGYLQELLRQGKLKVVSTAGYPILQPVR